MAQNPEKVRISPWRSKRWLAVLLQFQLCNQRLRATTIDRDKQTLLHGDDVVVAQTYRYVVCPVTKKRYTGCPEGGTFF